MWLPRTFRVWVFSVLVMTAGTPLKVDAGEMEVYLKTGWLALQETIAGKSFVRDEGWINGAGILGSGGSDNHWYQGKLEVWGGDLSYNGHDLQNTVPIISRSAYVGTTEEAISGETIFPTDRGGAGIFVGIGHKFWIRTNSAEDWNCIYAKAGLSGELSLERASLFANAGALFPLYTRIHADLSSSGYEGVVTYPKSQLSGFGAAGVRLSRFVLSVEYEAMHFGKSPEVALNSSVTQPGVAVSPGRAFQPDTRIDQLFFRVAYRF